MTSGQIKQTTADYILPTYARFDLALTKGEGCTAWDPEGNAYLDMTSGIGVNSLGFCDPAWVEAVATQAATLQHTSNLFYTEPGAKLAEALCTRTGMAKAFFANSGAEANEGAIKAARKYSLEKYGAGRATILSLRDSFHGRTMATLSATGQDVFHEHFFPFPEGFKHTEWDDYGAALTEDVCAVLVEVVQGEGGVIAMGAQWLQNLQKLCNIKDVLLIVDEVQTGIGRTGSLLACQQLGITPDIVTLAKGLGGGLPIGAFLLKESCAHALTAGDHGSTYGANPVCSAGALAVLDRLDETFLAGVRKKATLLQEGLKALPGVEEVSGLGLMLGITFKENIKSIDVVNAARENGLLCLTAKHKLRLLPPLIITEEEIGKALSKLETTLKQFV